MLLSRGPLNSGRAEAWFIVVSIATACEILGRELVKIAWLIGLSGEIFMYTYEALFMAV